MNVHGWDELYYAGSMLFLVTNSMETLQADVEDKIAEKHSSVK